MAKVAAFVFKPANRRVVICFAQNQGNYLGINEKKKKKTSKI